MEGIFKKHFQRCFWSKADTFCTDIRCVLDGIKPALLIDCLPPNPDKVNLFLQEVIEREQSNRDILICLLNVHEDLLIINVSAFLHLIQSAWPPVLLDVYGRPKIVTEHRKEQIFQTITSFIKPVFRELNTSMKPSDASFSVPNLLYFPPLFSLEPLVTHSKPLSLSATSPSSSKLPSNLPSPEERNTQLLLLRTPQVLSLSLPSLSPTSPQSSHFASSEEASINLCTVFGCLLQYPAVYWFNSEKGHCLDMEELVQHKVIVEKRNTCGSKHKVVFRGGSRGFAGVSGSLSKFGRITIFAETQVPEKNNHKSAWHLCLNEINTLLLGVALNKGEVEKHDGQQWRLILIFVCPTLYFEGWSYCRMHTKGTTQNMLFYFCTPAMLNQKMPHVTYLSAT